MSRLTKKERQNILKEVSKGLPKDPPDFSNPETSRKFWSRYMKSIKPDMKAIDRSIMDSVARSRQKVVS